MKMTDNINLFRNELPVCPYCRENVRIEYEEMPEENETEFTMNCPNCYNNFTVRMRIEIYFDTDEQ